MSGKSGVQLPSLRPCHQRPGLPRKHESISAGVPVAGFRSQQNANGLTRCVSVGLGQTVPTSASSAADDGEERGRWMRRKGTVERYACSTVEREKGLSERRSATVGYASAMCASESGRVDWRCHTPSISRTYLGLNFFFSALHWARTRMRRLSSPSESGGAPGRCVGAAAKGSHHHPTRSMPPSDLPPTRRRAMERFACNSRSERCSKAAPRCTADRWLLIVGRRAEWRGRLRVGGRTDISGVTVFGNSQLATHRSSLPCPSMFLSLVACALLTSSSWTASFLVAASKMSTSRWVRCSPSVRRCLP